jgi:hypothetical protein
VGCNISCIEKTYNTFLYTGWETTTFSVNHFTFYLHFFLEVHGKLHVIVSLKNSRFMQQIKPSHYSADEGDGLDPLHSLQYNQKPFICG